MPENSLPRETIHEYHMEFYSFLEKYREKYPGFNHGFRKNNTDNRLEDGFLFRGNNKYLSISLSNEDDVKNKTATLDISYDFKTNEVYFNVYCSDINRIKFYTNLCDEFGLIFESNDNNNRIRRRFMIANLCFDKNWERLHYYLERLYKIIPAEIRISDEDYELMKAQVFQNI